MAMRLRIQELQLERARLLAEEREKDRELARFRIEERRRLREDTDERERLKNEEDELESHLATGLAKTRERLQKSERDSEERRGRAGQRRWHVTGGQADRRRGLPGAVRYVGAPQGVAAFEVSRDRRSTLGGRRRWRQRGAHRSGDSAACAIALGLEREATLGEREIVWAVLLVPSVRVQGAAARAGERSSANVCPLREQKSDVRVGHGSPP